MRLKSIIFSIALLFPGSQAFGFANPVDQQMAKHFIDQCPACNPVRLQYFNNQQRRILAATSNQPLTLKPGFYLAHQPEIPEKVKRASRGVYSLIVLAEDEETYPQFFTYQLAATYKKLASAGNSHSRRVAQAVKIYLDRCQSQSQPLCRAPLKSGAIGAGSGVLIGQAGKELWTAGHVFEEPFRQALKALNTGDVQELVKRGRTFKVLVYNSENKLVAHPFNNSLRLTYSASPSVVARLAPEIKRDNLRFEFRNSLGSGLEIAPEITEGSNVYSVGYPSCTGCAPVYSDAAARLVSSTRFPHRDATNFDHQLTLGQVVGHDDNLIITNADAHGGMSGGATLDEEGRVIGINSAVSVTLSSPHFLADRRLKLSRPALWTAALVRPRT